MLFIWQKSKLTVWYLYVILLGKIKCDSWPTAHFLNKVARSKHWDSLCGWPGSELSWIINLVAEYVPTVDAKLSHISSDLFLLCLSQNFQDRLHLEVYNLWVFLLLLLFCSVLFFNSITNTLSPILLNCTALDSSASHHWAVWLKLFQVILRWPSWAS